MIASMLLRPELVHITKKNGINWLLIFYHNTKNQDYFVVESLFLFSNTPTMFSLWGLITEEFKIDGYYEFLLEYPDYDGFNQWKQSKFPLDVQEVNEEILITPSNVK